MLEFLKSVPDQASDGWPVVVLLHGRGSDMRDLQELAGTFPPAVTLVTPQAPHPGAPWGYGPGWAWYRYLGEDRPDGQSLSQSLSALAGFLDTLPDHLGFRPGTLVLGGFSQGGTTSLAYALTHPEQIQGVINLSGFLANTPAVEMRLEALRKIPLFWAHGSQDPAVPFSLALKGWEALREVGGRLEAREYPMGHWVSPEEMEDLQRWLVREIPDWPERITPGPG